MANKSTVLRALLLSALAACADSNSNDGADASTNTQDGGAHQAGGGSGGSHGASGSGGHAASNSSGGNSGTLTCAQREAQAGDAVQSAIVAAGASCSAKSDCEVISLDTDCHASCGGLVSASSKGPAEAAIRAQNQGVCKDFEADGCKRFLPPCDASGDFDCIDGECLWREGATDAGQASGADAGTAADSGTASQCVAQTILWGPTGGFGLLQPRFKLEPCNDFEYAITQGQEPGNSMSCANKVADDAAVSIADVNTALTDPDVKAAVAKAVTGEEVVYGADGRPLDAPIFTVQIGDEVIAIGGDCSATPPCKAIPKGISQLRETMMALGEQQRMLPNCDSVP